MIPTGKGAWSLQEVKDKITQRDWKRYNPEKDIGTLWAWGNNGNGSIGDSSRNHRSSPVQIPGTEWCLVSSRSSSQVASIKSDGTMWIWGTLGACLGLGNASCPRTSSPVQIPGSDWCDVSLGYGHAMAIKTDGTAWVWGSGDGGKLGLNNNISVSSPIQLPGTEWCKASLGVCNSFGLKTDGTLWAWGCTGDLICQGSLTGAFVHRSSPSQIPGTDWMDVSFTSSHALARKNDGTLWAWGKNFQGSLGDLTILHRNANFPSQIPGNQWVDASAGVCLSIGAKADNTAWVWGFDYACTVLGTFNHSSPTQMPGTIWNVVTTGGNESKHAIKCDGTLWGWGDNASGVIGAGPAGLCAGSGIRASSPVQIPGSQWIDVSGGGCVVMARKRF